MLIPRLYSASKVFVIATLITCIWLAPFPSQKALAAGVVGNGTPGSCTEPALDTALTGGGLVTFNCGGAKTITLTSTKTISKDTTIQGGNLITLSGNNSVQVFQVDSGATLTLQNLTVANGKSHDGAGLYNNGGTVNVNHSTFTGNSADCTGAGTCLAYGGAINNQNNGVLNITDSTFSDNSGGPEPYDAEGGAIYNLDGNVTVIHSAFTNNVSQEGGAIENFGGTLEITGVSTFTLNVATRAGSPNGGAISNNNVLIVGDTTFDRNHASSTGGSFAYGGAIYSSDTLTVKDSTFTDNYAASAGGLGGAIWADYESKITGSDFSENYTGGNSEGGTAYYNTGTHRIEDSTISGRSGGLDSAGSGGAIYNKESTLTIINTTISDNRASSGGGIYNTNSGAIFVDRSNFDRNNASFGGGMYNQGQAEVASSSFSANTATSATYVEGGGICNSGVLTITRSTFDQNSATSTSSGSYAADGGGIATSNKLMVSDSTFSHNSVDTVGGAENGSAIFASEAMTITGSSFFENYTNEGDGTIYLTDGTFLVKNSTVYSNSVNTYGSAFWNYHLAYLTIHNSTITNNDGQAISLGPTDPGLITLTNSIVANNITNCMTPPVDNGGNLQFGGLIANSCGATIPILDPLLDPYADYGGPTLTMRLQPTSPAINQAAANCPALDQREFSRSNPLCDSGAYEVGGTGVLLSSSANPSLPWQQVTFTATVEESDAHTPTGTITFKDNGVVLDTVTVDATGKATYTILYRKNDDHPITAEYSGDANFNPSQSLVLIQIVSSINNFLPWITKQ